MNRPRLSALAACALLVVASSTFAQEKVLNLYSARHYASDQQLYDAFTKQTGIRIQRIEAGDEALLERLRNEGANSPADVVLLADAARLWKAQIEGLFQPVKSETLEKSSTPPVSITTVATTMTTMAAIAANAIPRTHHCGRDNHCAVSAAATISP